MHKVAMEMGKWAMEKAKTHGFDNLSAQDWDDLKDCMESVKCAICADKDYRIVEAMDECEQEEKYLGRMGYDRYRYADGRFAPKGRGHRMGYRPYLYMGEDDWMNEYTHNPDFMKPGYTESGKIDSRHGRSYDRFDENRRFYHESGDAATKKRMEDSIKDVFDDMESMVQDVWKDMTPEQKTQYRAKMTQLVQKMQ